MAMAAPDPRARLTMRKLCDDAVAEILQSHETATELGRRLGTSRQVVNNIRAGRVYKEVHPELPRRGEYLRALSCWNCLHVKEAWVPRGNGTSGTRLMAVCTLGIPDLKVEGVRFARYCSAAVLSDTPPPVDDESVRPR